MQFAWLYPIVYPILKGSFPSCLWSGDDSERIVALTFDDGPSPQWTPQLLEVLDRYGIPVSFFWLGARVSRWPWVVKAAYSRGHWIGLHGYDHRSFPLLGAAGLKESLEKTTEAIATAANLEKEYVQTHVRDVRPPNGLFTPQILNWLREWNYRPVMWSVVPEDWRRPGFRVVVERVRRQVTNGSLIVLHDGYDGGQDVAQTTAALVPQLLEQGYQFVTVDRLWRQNGLTYRVF